MTQVESQIFSRMSVPRFRRCRAFRVIGRTALLILLTAPVSVDRLVAAEEVSEVPGTGETVSHEAPSAWVRAIGGSNREWAVDVAADAVGRSVVLGHFHGITHPGDGLPDLESAGDSDVFVSRWSEAGDALWAHRFGGLGQDEGKAVVIGPTGNIYVTGFFSRTLELANGLTLTSRGSADVFVLALDPAGGLLWAESFGGPAGDVGYGLDVAADGGLYVTGYFQKTMELPGPAPDLTSLGATDGFLVRLSAGGEVTDAWSFGGPGSDEGHAVATGADGEAVICASFQQKIAFQGHGFESAGGNDVAIWRLSTDGKVQQGYTFGGPGADTCEDLAIDAQGTLYAAGSFFGHAELGALSTPGAGGSDAYALAIDRQKGPQWVRALGGAGSDFGFGIEPVGARLAVTGFSQLPREAAGFSGQANGFVVELDGQGEIVDRHTFEGEPAIQALGLALGGDPTSGGGDLFVAGMFRGAADLESAGQTRRLEGVGKFDVFLARLSRR